MFSRVPITMTVLSLTSLLTISCGEYASNDRGHSSRAEKKEVSQQDGLYSSDDAEYLLASIDVGYELDSDDPSITAYSALLDRLERKCPDADRDLVGDMAVRATELLADEAIPASILEMLEGADIALSGGNAKLGVDCAEVFASLVLLMTPGK